MLLELQLLPQFHAALVDRGRLLQRFTRKNGTDFLVSGIFLDILQFCVFGVHSHSVYSTGFGLFVVQLLHLFNGEHGFESVLQEPIFSLVCLFFLLFV